MFTGLHKKKKHTGNKTLVAVGLLTVRRWLTTFDCLRVQIDNQEIWSFFLGTCGEFLAIYIKKNGFDINRPAYARYDL